MDATAEAEAVDAGVAAHCERADDATEREDLDHGKPHSPRVAKAEHDDRGQARFRAVHDEERLGAAKARNTNTSDPPKRLYPCGIAAHWSRWTLYEWSRTGRIPHRKLPGRRELIFPLVDLEAFENGATLETVKLPGGGRICRPAGDL